MPNPYSDIPSYEDMFGGEYFSPADLHEGPVTAKITGVEYKELFCRGVGKNFKIILTLAGQKKKVCVNKTSAKALAFAWGKPTVAQDWQKWVGKSVAATGGEVNGKAAVLLRPVKDRQPAPQSAPPVPPPTPAPVTAESVTTTEEPGATDGLETAVITLVQIKPKDAHGKYTLCANDGTFWFADHDRVEAIRAMKCNGKPIEVTHFANHIDSARML